MKGEGLVNDEGSSGLTGGFIIPQLHQDDSKVAQDLDVLLIILQRDGVRFLRRFVIPNPRNALYLSDCDINPYACQQV